MNNCDDEKWRYIRRISNMSNQYGDLLIYLMDRYKKSNLRDVTLEECIEFYEDLLEM